MATSDTGTLKDPCDALAAARDIQREAASVGFDWPDARGVFAKVEEEILELREALDEGDILHAKTELGDVLFAVVNLSRFVPADPHEELSRATARFQRRFSLLREELLRQGRAIDKCSLEELDVVWEEVKRRETANGKMS